MSSTLGDRVRISIFGQSHGEMIGAVIDGLPAGERIDPSPRRAAKRTPCASFPAWWGA